MQYRAFATMIRHLVLGTALVFWLGGCASSPVRVTNCSVRKVDGASVAFEADVDNHDRRIADEVYVIVATKGLQTDDSRGGTQVEYDASGPFVPGVRTHRTIVTSRPPDLAERLGSIDECYVHAVDFSDGNHWEGPSPL